MVVVLVFNGAEWQERSPSRGCNIQSIRETGAGAMTNAPQAGWRDAWPVSVIVRQWRRAKTQTGWGRALSVARVGCEVILLVVVIAVIVI